MKYKRPFLSILLIIAFLCLLAACGHGGNDTTYNNAPQTDIPRSPRYTADSLRTFGKSRQILATTKDERATFPYIDSIFLLKVQMDTAAAVFPDSLTNAEGRQLFNEAIYSLMVSYNILMDFEGGFRHLDSIENLRIPFVERFCQRALWTAKAQMLMPLDRHTEAVDLLNRAMLLAGKNAENPFYDSKWSAAAGITYMGTDTISVRAEKAFMRVVDIARRTGLRTNLYGHAISRLADIYLRQGKYQQSIDLCEQVIAIATDRPADQSRFVAAENLTEAYRRLGLYDDALRYCAIVTESPMQYEVLNNLRGRSFMNKAGILTEMKRPAEALVALHQADSCFDRTGSNSYKIYVAIDRAHLLSTLPDSLAAALALFAALDEQVPRHRHPFFHYYYGTARTAAGQYREAIPLLELAVPEAESITERLMAFEAARQLMECYRHTDQHARLADFVPRYQALSDSVESNAKIRQLASANIRFETNKKEQENRTLVAEVALKDSRLRTTLLIGALCLLTALAATVWGVMRQRTLALRQRLHKQEQQTAADLLHEKQEQMQLLIQSRQQTHQRNLDLLRQLVDIQTRSENSCNLDNIMESLQESLLSKEDAERFRSNFSAIYPSSLNRLRIACADVTRSEELFCMLVALRQSNDEMARTLGISNHSVSKTRYRLRLKLNLPEGSDVDAEIIRIMKVTEFSEKAAAPTSQEENPI